MVHVESSFSVWFGDEEYTVTMDPTIRELNLSYPLSANESAAAMVMVDWWTPSETESHTFATVLVGVVWIFVVLVVMALTFVVVWGVCFAIDKLGVNANSDEEMMVDIESRVTAPSTSEQSEVQRP